MGRGNDSLEADQKLDREPIVLRSLFDSASHKSIIEFLDQRVPLMPINFDQNDFVRGYANDVPFFTAIHKQLVELATEIFCEPVKPSYSFLSMYQNNGTCPLHIDRPQCRYTIDYLIRQSEAEAWPIRIANPMSDNERLSLEESGIGRPESDEDIQQRIESETWHEVNLSPNDAVCYSGTHSWHYRPTRLNGTADLCFFHFVPVDFDGPLN